MSIFKYGDRVKVNTNGTDKLGKIISIRGNTYVGFTCVVDFDSPPILIPQQMEFAEEDLVLCGRKSTMFNRQVDTNKYCPVCSESWHEVESPIHGSKEIWTDCLKCNKTKEELMKGNK